MGSYVSDYAKRKGAYAENVSFSVLPYLYLLPGVFQNHGKYFTAIMLIYGPVSRPALF